MSLLMEALKKAEEAKRLASEGQTPADFAASNPPLELMPASPPSSLPPSNSPSPNSPLPDLAMHIDSVDADLSAVSTEQPVRRKSAPFKPPPKSTPPQEFAERDAIRNVFSAKQAPKSQTALWIMLGLGGVIALAIGGYFWWQLQAVSRGSLAHSTPARPLPPPVQPAVPSPSPVLVATPVESPPAKPAPAEPAPSTTQVAISEPATLFERAARPQKPSTNTQRATESPQRLNRMQPKPGTLLDRAYDALQAGKFDEAQQDYEQVLRVDGKNIDALLGMATLASQQGQSERAQGFYLLALEVAPKDATAQAGLINTRGRTNPALSESKLKTSLAAQPDSPALLFALGNLYASQSRWSDAQQAFFRAYSTDPDNADYLFNLAVSLDHLHQNKLAAQYYQMALNAANNSRSISFDKKQVNSRILELQP